MERHEDGVGVRRRIGREAGLKDYFREYLRVAPLSLALWRAAEARAIGVVEMPRPLLDIGCGFGEFGGAFFDEPADVGLDVSASDIAIARTRDCYRELALADGRRLPFAEGAFASVLSVSVVEHIDEAERVIPEAFRVLRPGGVFVFTTPAPEMGALLFYSRLFAALRLRPLATAYGRTVERIFHHVSLKPLETWRAEVERAGFRVREARETIPPRLTTAFDLTLPGALPSQLGRFSKRGRWVWRPPGAVALLSRLFGGLVEEEGEPGCNYIVVADKP